MIYGTLCVLVGLLAFGYLIVNWLDLSVTV